MIFNTLDFHLHTQYGEEPVKLGVPFRLRINYIVDSFSLRIPRKIKTRLFHKLNVLVSYKRWWRNAFSAVEGIGMVEFLDPHIRSIYDATPAEQIKRVKAFLRRGIRIAAKHDRLFGRHLKLWERLLSTVDEEFDHYFRMSRSHRSRHWRCNAVLRITPTAYHYDVVVKDSKSLETIQRHRIKTTESAFPFYSGIGFSKLRWDKDDIVGLTRDDKEVFRFHTGLSA
jgi:hypothetical protein